MIKEKCAYKLLCDSCGTLYATRHYVAGGRAERAANDLCMGFADAHVKNRRGHRTKLYLVSVDVLIAVRGSEPGESWSAGESWSDALRGRIKPEHSCPPMFGEP